MKKKSFLISTIFIFVILLSLNVLAISCSDSDNGKNPNVKGMVTGTFANGNAFSIIDFCSVSSPNKVSEQYCIDTNTGAIGGNSPTSIWISCDSGKVCQDGQCVNSGATCSQVNGICRNTCNFGEMNAGILNCGSGSLCCKAGAITECPAGTENYYCSSTNVGSRFRCQGGITYEYSCGSGYHCSNGNCISNGGGNGCTPTCSDTDGKDTSVQGEITAKFANCQTYTTKDFCSVSSPNKVSEGFCLGDSPSSGWIDCPSGQECLEGRCVSNRGTCESNDGTCQDICDVGKIAIGEGFPDCGSKSCCKEGSITNCPPDHPDDKAYCDSAVGSNQYLVCKGGVTYTLQCKGDKKCSDGVLCYGSNSWLAKLGESLANAFKFLTNPIFNFIQTFRIILSVIIGLAGTILGWFYARRFAILMGNSQKTANKRWALFLLIGAILGIALAILVYYYFWYGLLAWIVLAIVKIWV